MGQRKAGAHPAESSQPTEGGSLMISDVMLRFFWISTMIKYVSEWSVSAPLCFEGRLGQG